ALQRLKIMFGLTDASIARVHNQVVRRLYRKSLEQVLSDKKWDPSRKAFLRSVEERLKLPANVADRIRRDKISDWVGSAFVKALSDERLSPEEDKELEILANHLGVELEFDEKTKNRLDRYRLYWLIDNGEIPVIETAIPLRKNEKCYFAADARWCELRTVTRKARYGAPGMQQSEQQSHIQSKTFQEIVPIEEGRVYLTSKRVFFYGPKKQRSILLSHIQDFVPMDNGIHIHRKTGASPFIELELGIDIFALILARRLRDLHS
ncbi:MAG TPA: hypothetical protein VJ521_08015, partial [Acidobacteriota bacterium]|nr:hypothetical protein [Acidobacteriota bacterium]